MAHLFLPLIEKFGDAETNTVFTAGRYIDACISAEVALARAQADEGVIPAEAAAAIEEAARVWHVDADEVWQGATTVGYPVLPLLQQLEGRLPEQARGYLHWGATTQDIMDTALAIQLRDVTQRLESLLEQVGDAIAALAVEHAGTVMPARTHGQQAVPTTFGLKCSVWLAEVERHLDRLEQLRPRLLRGQLAGAGGTLASLGPAAARVRVRFCEILELGTPETPWHTARDCLAEFATVLGLIASTCGKVGREVTDLARDEIAEVSEVHTPLRGASSTMPQKRNPITAEAVVGFSILAAGLAQTFFQTMQPRHERAAGEWQAEWDAMPLLCAATAGALAQLERELATLQVHPQRMRENLMLNGQVIMSESVMMALAPQLGREEAHRLVYKVAQQAIDQKSSLREALAELDGAAAAIDVDAALSADSYIGEAAEIARQTAARWQARRDGRARTTAP